MAVRVVRLGSPRAAHEGLRIGTVRKPPRGVPKSEFGKRDYYDVWFPTLAPSLPVMKLGLRGKTDDRAWKAFVRKYRAEMKKPEPSRAIDLLTALSHHTDFAIGCYCEDEQRCHRSILRDLLSQRGATLVSSS